MANKPAKSERQAKIDAIRKSQKGGEKRRGYAIVGVCALVALLIIAAAAYRPIKNWYDLREFKGKELADIGVPASDCQDITTQVADGNQEHVPEGTSVTYTTAPPAFGAHWNVAGLAPAAFTRKLYTSDRPPLEALVHNLEHGYTILWYDKTIADNPEDMTTLKAIADQFTGSNQRNKFIAAPWTSADEDDTPFPDDQHVAFTHWSAGGSGVTDTTKQVGVFQYCSAPSGAALEKFMLEYPYTDSPEPGAA